VSQVWFCCGLPVFSSGTTRDEAGSFYSEPTRLCQVLQGARGDQCDTCCQTLDAIELIDKKCKICSSSPIAKKSKHLFLNLPELQSQIEGWYNSAKEGHHWSANGKAFTEAWLRDGLRERCLTRDLKWGVPVPIKGWEDKVMYVWVSLDFVLSQCMSVLYKQS
jgi:methionyl-tRNA synthetase